MKKALQFTATTMTLILLSTLFNFYIAEHFHSIVKGMSTLMQIWISIVTIVGTLTIPIAMGFNLSRINNWIWGNDNMGRIFYNRGEKLSSNSGMVSKMMTEAELNEHIRILEENIQKGRETVIEYGESEDADTIKILNKIIEDVEDFEKTIVILQQELTSRQRPK